MIGSKMWTKPLLKNATSLLPAACAKLPFDGTNQIDYPLIRVLYVSLPSTPRITIPPATQAILKMSVRLGRQLFPITQYSVF